MKSFYCIAGTNGCMLTVIGSGFEMVVEGSKCEKGTAFAKAEMSNPSRTLTTTVRTNFPGVPVLSVRTDGEIPRNAITDAMKELSEVIIKTDLNCGDEVLENIAETGVRVIVTSSALMNIGAELENKNVELTKRGSSNDASAASFSDSSPGTGIVRNANVLDDLGPDAAGGFVGAAGEAVGVEGTFDENEADETQKGEGRIKQKGRSHIQR